MSLESAAAKRVGTTVLDKWRIERLIACGGAAAVYAAVHRNGHRAALKMLHAKWRGNTDVIGRLEREAQISNAIAHAGVVRVFDDGMSSEGDHFLLMELLRGETLRDRCARKGHGLAYTEVLALADDALAILEAAHAAGIWHRDLKPDNLLFTTDGVLKLLDFGIGRFRTPSRGPEATAAHVPMGTVGFMAPEQARGEWHRVDARTDLWALGATMFTLLTGQTIHRGIGEAMLGQAPELADISPHLPADVIGVVQRALASHPKERWQDARTMSTAVRAAYWRRPVFDRALATPPEGLRLPRFGDSGEVERAAPRGFALRVHTRHSLALAVDVADSGDGRFRGMAIDASAGGALLRSPKHLAVGSNVRLTLDLGSGVRVHDVDARVLRAEVDPANTPLPFVVAVEFTAPDSALTRVLEDARLGDASALREHLQGHVDSPSSGCSCPSSA